MQLLAMKSPPMKSLSMLASIFALTVTVASGCAHRPQGASSSEATRSELARMEGNIAARRSQLPTVSARAAAPEAVPSLSASATQSAPAPRCDGVCQAAQAICGYSRRICQLAEQIADEPSQRSCKNSDRECADASGLCATCR